MRVLPMRRHWLAPLTVALLAIAALAAAPIGRSLAQDYPHRTIRVIMPLGPGGIGDIFVRALAQELTKTLGQPLVIENRPGGATLVGSQACAQSPPDGYTLCMLAIDSFSIAPFFSAKLPYDPEKDFAPIVRLFFIGQGLVVHRSLGVDTLADLVALSKAKPGTLSYAAQANQITMVMEDLKRNTGADLQRIPYQAGGQAVSALLAGQVPVGFLGIGNVLPQVQEGLVKLLAVDGSSRSPLYPAAPTFVEAGYSAPIIRPWYGLFAPAGTPKPIIDRVQAEVSRLMKDPTFVERHLVARGLEPAVMTADEFARFLVADRELAKRLAEASGLKP